MTKIMLFIVVVLAVAVNVQGEGKCGNLDQSYCPEGTVGISITKKTSKEDKTKLIVTIKCEDSSNAVIAECTDTQASPYPNVHINSFQFTGNYKHTVQRHNHQVVTNSNDNDNDNDNNNDDIETFQ